MLEPGVRQLRVAVFGDSIAAGLGVRGKAFPVLVADALGAELVNLAFSAQQITGSLELATKATDCDLVIVAHGGTECLVRPLDSSLRLVPRRWRRPGWLDPRPYFSSRRLSGLAQRAESAIRWRVKVALIRLWGGVRWLEPAEYEAALSEMVARVGKSRVVVLGIPMTDERYFPGSVAELKRYNEIGERVADAAEAEFVDITDACRRWSEYCADRAHPNDAGHEKIASRLLSAIGRPDESRPARRGTPVSHGS